MKNKIIENIKTIFIALLLAVIIRTLILQPFYIPSSSMEKTLLVGDRLFVTKYSYGYSQHSFPFSVKFFSNRIFYSIPSRGDVIVFKTPADNSTDYIKRLIGLPGDEIQFINGDLYLNKNKINKNFYKDNFVYCGSYKVNTVTFYENISESKKYLISYFKNDSMKNSDVFIVPKDHFFFMGDNRDCSKDSRFLTSVGYVHKNNLVGKAQFIFFSNDSNIGDLFTFWKWHKSIRWERFFKKIH